MKKKIIVIVLSVVLISVVVALVLLSSNNDKKQPDYNIDKYADITALGYNSVGEALLEIDSYEQIEVLTKNNELDFEEELGCVYINDVELFNGLYYFSFDFDENNKVRSLIASTILTSENGLSATQLHEKCDKILSDFAHFFAGTDDYNYFIYNINGDCLDNGTDSSYEKIIKGEAFLEFNIRKSSQSFWKITIKSLDGKNVSCLVENFINDENYANMMGDINLDA